MFDTLWKYEYTLRFTCICLWLCIYSWEHWNVAAKVRGRIESCAFFLFYFLCLCPTVWLLWIYVERQIFYGILLSFVQTEAVLWFYFTQFSCFLLSFFSFVRSFCSISFFWQCWEFLNHAIIIFNSVIMVNDYSMNTHRKIYYSCDHMERLLLFLFFFC